MQSIISFISKYVVLSYTEGFEKYIKYPVLLSVTDGKKSILSNKDYLTSTKYTYNNEPDFIVHLGGENDIILIDFDVNKINKVDGLKWFEENFGPIITNFGLITKTPSGGFHAFCKYDNRIISTIGMRLKNNDIAIDIMSTNNIAFQGRYYPVVKNTGIREMPENFFKLIQKLNIKYIHNKDDIITYQDNPYTLTDE